MIRDDNGIAVPSGETLLPWKVESDEMVSDHCGCVVVRDGDAYPETLHFIVHAANYHAQLADIVRRLAEWHSEAVAPGGSLSFNLIKISREAKELWEEMTQEGGEDEG